MDRNEKRPRAEAKRKTKAHFCIYADLARECFLMFNPLETGLFYSESNVLRNQLDERPCGFKIRKGKRELAEILSPFKRTFFVRQGVSF